MNYQATAKKVAKQLKAKGAPVTIIRPGDATGWTKDFDLLNNQWYWTNDITEEVVYDDPATPQQYPTFALVLPASAGAIQAFDIRFESGTLIESNLRSLTIAAADLAITPHPGDVIEFAGERWTLLGNTPFTPDGETTIYHQCTAKRGG